MGHSIFITGTDTGVGKTFFTSGMIRALRSLGIDVVGFKPIECGGRRDSRELRDAADGLPSLDEVNPVWFDQPLSPMAAADSVAELNLDLIRETHAELSNRHELVMVEGAGGWLVPLSGETSMADLAVELCDEVIIVAANRLGVLNHVFLTLEAIRRNGIDCARVILNHPPRPSGSEPGYGPALPSEATWPADSANDLSLSSNADLIAACRPEVDVFRLRDESCFSRLAQTIFSL